ncbi:hypothetical protein QBC40DRAFT_258556 [Triangularia verruculosa]|uniref:Uncharacterized protein n=1 Tax=Triangularia verruculosa TaxID=2587418 RepID=A0AAN6X845_9PEZI|nr:hypothetical protein QBC40DRAFT_258556 [Triangularia verruculosa]
MSDEGTPSGEKQLQPDGGEALSLEELTWSLPVIPGMTMSLPIPTLGLQVQISPLDNAFARAGVIGGLVPNGTTMQITAVLPRPSAPPARREASSGPSSPARPRASLPGQQRALAHVEQEEVRPSSEDAVPGVGSAGQASVNPDETSVDVSDGSDIRHGTVLEIPGLVKDGVEGVELAVEALTPAQDGETSGSVIEVFGSAEDHASNPATEASSSLVEGSGLESGDGSVKKGFGEVPEDYGSGNEHPTSVGELPASADQGSGLSSQDCATTNEVLPLTENVLASISGVSPSIHPPRTSTDQPAASAATLNASTSIHPVILDPVHQPLGPRSKGKALENISLPSSSPDETNKLDATSTTGASDVTSTAATTLHRGRQPLSSIEPPSIPEEIHLIDLEMEETRLQSEIQKLEQDLAEDRHVVRKTRETHTNKIDTLNATILQPQEKLRAMELCPEAFSNNEIVKCRTQLANHRNLLRSHEERRANVDANLRGRFTSIKQRQESLRSLIVELKTVRRKIVSLTGEERPVYTGNTDSVLPTLVAGKVIANRTGVMDLFGEEKRTIEAEKLMRRLEMQSQHDDYRRLENVQSDQQVQRNAKRKREDDDWKQREEERASKDRQRNDKRLASYNHDAGRSQGMSGFASKGWAANGAPSRQSLHRPGQQERETPSREPQHPGYHSRERQRHRRNNTRNRRRQDRQDPDREGHHASQGSGSGSGSRVDRQGPEHQHRYGSQGSGHGDLTDRQGFVHSSHLGNLRPEHRAQESNHSRAKTEPGSDY